MAVTNIIRRASQVVPLGVRVIGRSTGYQIRYSTLLVNRGAASRNFFRSTPSDFHCYSTKGPSSDDESLPKNIEWLIQRSEESAKLEENQVPDGFPFVIEDNPNKKIIRLCREYEGEIIKCEVCMPDLITVKVNEGTGSSDDDDGMDSQVPVIITVSVYKKNGQVLEISCTACACVEPEDMITIESVSIKDPTDADDHAYAGPDFSYFGKNLHCSFLKYLKIRGIDKDTTNFLRLYMINKDRSQYKTWLKNLKHFC